MKNLSNATKKISLLWFYLFALFFGSLGIVLLVKPDPTLSPFLRFILGPLFFLVGFSFLLEPLQRRKKLPPDIARRYEAFTSNFGRTHGSVRTTFLTISIATVAMSIFFCSDTAFGSTWSTVRVYIVGTIGFFAAFFVSMTVVQMLRDWGPERWRQSGFVNSVAAFAQGASQQELQPNARSVSNFIFYMVLFLVGFYATLTIREGSIFGPLALVVMVIMSFGQSMVFGQEVKARAAVEHELKTAHDMQMGLMPKEDPHLNGFEISGTCLPANEVGGDYFDYVWLDQKRTKLGIAIADVSGKAMKAAITAVMTSGMIYREIENDDTPRSILRKINRPMYLKTDRQVFTAMSFAVIDAKKKVLRFSNAGQSQPMLVRGGKLSYIKVRGARLPLGVMAEQNYMEASVKLKSGDILLFYTDGLPEATNAEHRLLGFEAVEEELMKRRMSSATDIVLGMTELVNRHTGKTEQHDDMTVVVVKVA
jgi:hypothetical protein